eukprot:tig00001030_g6461.t1
MPTVASLPPIGAQAAPARGLPTLGASGSKLATAAMRESASQPAGIASASLGASGSSSTPQADDPSVLSFADSCLGDTALLDRLSEARLSSNVTAIRSLNLRGCNIHRGETILAFLQAFPNVESLLLEWNSLGLSEDAMKLMCQVLAKSNTIHQVRAGI